MEEIISRANLADLPSHVGIGWSHSSFPTQAMYPYPERWYSGSQMKEARVVIAHCPSVQFEDKWKTLPWINVGIVHQAIKYIYCSSISDCT